MKEAVLARNVEVHGITAASVAALATAVNAWLVARAETRLLDIQYQFVGADFTALIIFTE